MRSEYSTTRTAVQRARGFVRRAFEGIRASARLSALLVCATVTLGAIWIATQWGPGQNGTFDSAFYLDGSRHLAHGDGYVSASTQPERLDYAPVTRWAPGFPAMIAATMVLADVPALSAAAMVLGSAYVSCVLLILLLSMRLLGRHRLAMGTVAVLFFATQPDALAALDILLSDLPFAALALLNTYLAVKIAQAQRSRFFELGTFGCCLATMVMVRYAGALFVPGLMMALGTALLLRRRRLLEVVRVLLVPSIVLTASIAAWIVRNRQFGPEPFGERHPSQATFAEMLEPAARGALSWWFTIREIAGGAKLEYLVPAATLLACCTCVALAISNSARAREALLFTVLPSASYFILMVFAASNVRFDPIGNARFWIPVWPLSIIAVSALIAASTRVWSHIASFLLGVMAAALIVGQAALLQRNLPSAQERRGLLAERWQRASVALPEPLACRLFVTDVRPFMLHRELGPTSEIPLTRGDFDSAASRHASLCIATLSKRLRVSSTAERRRVEQNVVVDALRAEGRLDQIGGTAGVTLYRLKKQ